MAGRLTVLSDDRLDALRPVVEARVRETARLISEAPFDEFFDPTMRAFLVNGLAHCGAEEGTLWLLDATRSFLVPRFNNGPNAEDFVGHFRQTLRSGMISMVVATEQPICENDVHKNEQQDKRLDDHLGLRTCAMLAVPFYFAGELRGVISAVQLEGPTTETAVASSFTMEHLRALQNVASVLQRVVEHHLFALALGTEGMA